MLARSTLVRHPSGQTFITPLLVPSFSSKGFGLSKSRISEAGRLFRAFRESITEAVLLSSYDISQKHIAMPRQAFAKLVFLDSGGYETSDFMDLSATHVLRPADARWTEEDLRKVLDAWSDRIPAVFVGYDNHGKTLPQIRKAHRLLRRYPRQLHAILLKPEREGQLLNLPELVGNAAELKVFDIVGVTEKELGHSTFQRMEAIAKIRLALDDADLRRVPLHVFGSLDPVAVPLYFLAGAEIFDGLTWLRYGYHNGTAMYHHNCAALTVGIDHSDDQMKLRNMANNLDTLSKISNQLRRYLNDGKFAWLSPHSALMSESFELLRSKNPRVA